MTDDVVDDFLAHYGVKGMKWGVRNSSRPAGAPRRGPSNDTLKKIGTEIGFGSLGPAAVLAGLGPPVSIAIGMSVAVLRQPPVRQAIASSSKATANLMKEIGDTKMSAIRQAKETKVAAKKAAAAADRRLSQAVNVADKTIDAAGKAHDAYTSTAGTIIRLT